MLERSRYAIGVSLACVLVACGQRVTPVTSPVVPLRTAPIPIGSGPMPSERFGSVFCGVLAHLASAGVDWGYCGSYFSPSGSASAVSKDIDGIAEYRVLVVPGIFGQCVEAVARPFEDAARHLRLDHGVEVEYVSVSALGSAPYNARQINEYLARQFSGADQRRYIAFGYSKGAADLLEAIAADGPARRGVAALVTIAGSVLGSRLTQGVPRRLLDFLQDARIGTCDVGDGGGIDSLRRSERAEAVARFVAPAGFRAYSIAAVSNAATTSAVLMSGWRQLRAYSLEQDSQMIHEDAIVPGASYLGTAMGDHWAVALPFEDVPEEHPLKRAISRGVNQNHYPRVALFEAAVRFVVADRGGV